MQRMHAALCNPYAIRPLKPAYIFQTNALECHLQLAGNCERPSPAKAQPPMIRKALFLLALTSSACTNSVDTTAHDSDADPLGGDPTSPAESGLIDPCQGTPGVQFPAAICVCESFEVTGNLDARGSGQAGGATVAVNGQVVLLSNMDIEGSMLAYRGLDTSGNGHIRGDLITTGSTAWLGNLELTGDFNIGGDLDGLANLELAGDLRLGGINRMLGNLEIGGHAPYVAPSGPPCPCGPDSIFDVSSVVAAAKHAPAITRLSTSLEGNTDLRLTTGAYYAEHQRWLGNTAVTVDGHVDLFIDDSLSALGNGEIMLPPGSTLDLYVAGSLASLGNTWVGAQVPGAVRLYVGHARDSDATVVHAGNTKFFASLYAPSARVEYLGNAEIMGAIFARSLTVEGNFAIAYPGVMDPPAPSVCPRRDPPTTGASTSGNTSTGESSGGPNTSTTGSSGGSSGDGSSSGTGTVSGTGSGTGEGATSGDSSGSSTGSCPELENDCHAIVNKFVCMAADGCAWNHGLSLCKWHSCGGHDQMMCELDPACLWDACETTCYPASAVVEQE